MLGVIVNVLDSIKEHYRSGQADLGNDFFRPCLRACSGFDRAVGFFSSSALKTWATVLPSLVNATSVRIRLLASPYLSADDTAALAAASSEGDRTLIRQALADRIVDDAVAFARSPEDLDLRTKMLVWLIACGRLEIRFAFARHTVDPGMFHEKIGVFYFPDGRRVAFTGSANESLPGHSTNYESLDVYRDWHAPDRARVDVKVQQFIEAWNGDAKGLEVLALSTAALKRIRTIAPERPPTESDRLAEQRNDRLWKHQEEAVNAFVTHERGVLEMATGTGKTRTALAIIKKLIQAGAVETVIISADGTDLLNQWYRQVVSVADDVGFTVTRRYADHREFDFYAISPARRFHLCSRQRLPQALDAIPAPKRSKALVIHDEVHRLGSSANRRDLDGLEEGIRFRLGLSATPEREYDADGNAFIEKHVGPTIFQFPLQDAIRRGILSPFDYHPIEWTPTEEDKARVQQVYKQVSAREASGAPMSQEEIWMAIANVYKTSPTKLPLFRQFLHEHADLLAGSIIFVATKEYAEQIIPSVHERTLQFHTYFEGEDGAVLKRFAAQRLSCLITCHRLSEGIDIRSIRTVFLLAADRAKLETIQRIGRCLRVDPNDPAKRASVVDFIRVEKSNPRADTADLLRRNWLREVSLTRPEI